MNNELAILEKQIKSAEAKGLPIDKYVSRQIEILKSELQIFLDKMAKDNRLNDVAVVELEIRQYATMRELAKKIGQPFSEYNKKIKAAQCRIVGEENWELFFGKQH